LAFKPCDITASKTGIKTCRNGNFQTDYELFKRFEAKLVPIFAGLKGILSPKGKYRE
jgi:hypothetical protein